MGKSTLVMLFLLAFGPNGGPSSHKSETRPPIVKTETLTSLPAAPEETAGTAQRKAIDAPPAVSTHLEIEGPSSPTRVPEHPESGRENV